MRQMFVLRVKEKEAELKDSEKEVYWLLSNRIRAKANFFFCFICFQLHAKFDKLKKDHAEEKRKLEEARKKLEEEFLEFNRRKTQIAASHHTLTLGKKNKK